ncbi:MAG: hypothetical protein R3C12_12440 [Planctomycetaceae bacterium]
MTLIIVPRLNMIYMDIGWLLRRGWREPEETAGFEQTRLGVEGR